MNVQHLFCLSGWGKLREIIQLDNKFIVRVCMVAHVTPSELLTDEVLIDCEVFSELYKTHLNALSKLVKVGECIKIHFTAEYGAFLDAYMADPPEEPGSLVNLGPERIVSLRATLHEFKGCSINDCLIELKSLN